MAAENLDRPVAPKKRRSVKNYMIRLLVDFQEKEYRFIRLPNVLHWQLPCTKKK